MYINCIPSFYFYCCVVTAGVIVSILVALLVAMVILLVVCRINSFHCKQQTSVELTDLQCATEEL
jgi:uncharacterized membrane-anchored protein YhcB (DUF1043 family)